jgi:glycosyltransferase involved in cell wall biosynthesis
MFLSDDPPLKSKGSGISVLLFNILSALKGKNVVIVTSVNSAIAVTAAEIRDDNSGFKTIVYDETASRFFQKNKISLFKSIVSSLCFLFNLKKIRSNVNEDDLVISMVGVSSKPLWKFLLVSVFNSKAMFGLYIVDDLELINKKLKRTLELMIIKSLLPLCLKRADYVITISEGLRRNYVARHKKDSLILLPTFSKRPSLPEKRIDKQKFTLLFTGGLSFLYNSTLLKIAGIIERHNTLLNEQFELIVQTYSSYAAFKELGFNEEYVKYSRVESRDDLKDIYTNCDCFFVPYSFNEEDRDIVASSFPQKLAEIIQYGKPLLVVGPSYSSIVSFFKKNNLKYVIDENDLGQLEEILLHLKNNKPEEKEKHLFAYERFFSNTAVELQFQNLMSLN